MGCIKTKQKIHAHGYKDLNQEQSSHVKFGPIEVDNSSSQADLLEDQDKMKDQGTNQSKMNLGNNLEETQTHNEMRSNSRQEVNPAQGIETGGNQSPDSLNTDAPQSINIQMSQTKIHYGTGKGKKGKKRKIGTWTSANNNEYIEEKQSYILINMKSYDKTHFKMFLNVTHSEFEESKYRSILEDIWKRYIKYLGPGVNQINLLPEHLDDATFEIINPQIKIVDLQLGTPRLIYIDRRPIPEQKIIDYIHREYGQYSQARLRLNTDVLNKLTPQKQILIKIQDLKLDSTQDLYKISNVLYYSIAKEDYNEKFYKILRQSIKIKSELDKDQNSQGIKDWIQINAQLQREVQDFEKNSLFICIKILLKELESIDKSNHATKYLQTYLNLNEDEDDDLYYESGILVTTFQMTQTNYSKLNYQLMLQSQDYQIPLRCTFNLYGRVFDCFAFPDIEFRNIIEGSFLDRNNDQTQKLGLNKLSENLSKIQIFKTAPALSKKEKKLAVLKELDNQDNQDEEYLDILEDNDDEEDQDENNQQQTIGEKRSGEIYQENMQKYQVLFRDECLELISSQGQSIVNQKILIQEFARTINEALFSDKTAQSLIDLMNDKYMCSLDELANLEEKDISLQIKQSILERVIEKLNIEMQSEFEIKSVEAKFDPNSIKSVPISSFQISEQINEGLFYVFYRLFKFKDYKFAYETLNGFDIDDLKNNQRNLNLSLMILKSILCSWQDMGLRESQKQQIIQMKLKLQALGIDRNYKILTSVD
ncbi:UNKNOWN [Stylonychia lemnae]|uniref:Uncharacterized protein n=1 Tax=Stylonychia lemnae TaxID=5949 RepID=A0A078AVE5_STYLE|nr:UNKNOWN [Stylonychia lemnae]|eukprot:CDW86154.1 UNKNOWN [Stylonychia lemnae]